MTAGIKHIPCCHTKCPNCLKDSEFYLSKADLGFSDEIKIIGVICNDCGSEYKDPSGKDIENLKDISKVYQMYRDGEIDSETAQKEIEGIGSTTLNDVIEGSKVWVCKNCGNENNNTFDSCWKCQEPNKIDYNTLDRSEITVNIVGDRIAIEEKYSSETNNITKEKEILGHIESSQSGSSINGWILLIISLAIFAGLGAFRWDIIYIILLAFVIFIHECGHLLAMKLYKYKNLKMMFLPFIGGVASGRPDEHNSYKIAMISIFGPFIGFLSSIISMFIWFKTKEPIFLQYAQISVIINAFNLLPIVPLDGGHFINETLFNRFPKAELIFKIIAIFCLGYLAFTLKSFFLGIVAFFMYASLKNNYILSNIANTLRHKHDFQGKELTEEKIKVISDAISNKLPNFETGKTTKIIATEINGIWMKANKIYPTAKTVVFLLLVYFFIAFAFSTFTLGFVYGGGKSNEFQQGLEADPIVDGNFENEPQQ